MSINDSDSSYYNINYFPITEMSEVSCNKITIEDKVKEAIRRINDNIYILKSGNELQVNVILSSKTQDDARAYVKEYIKIEKEIQFLSAIGSILGVVNFYNSKVTVEEISELNAICLAAKFCVNLNQISEYIRVNFNSSIEKNAHLLKDRVNCTSNSKIILGYLEKRIELSNFEIIAKLQELYEGRNMNLYKDIDESNSKSNFKECTDISGYQDVIDKKNIVDSENTFKYKDLDQSHTFNFKDIK